VSNRDYEASSLWEFLLPPFTPSVSGVDILGMEITPSARVHTACFPILFFSAPHLSVSVLLRLSSSKVVPKRKSPGSDQIPAELFQAGDERYGVRSVNSLILFEIRKNYLISGRSLLLYQFTRRMIKVTVVIIVGYHCCQLHTIFYPIFFSRG
jgi:hypothetical protein